MSNLSTGPLTVRGAELTSRALLKKPTTAEILGRYFARVTRNFSFLHKDMDLIWKGIDRTQSHVGDDMFSDHISGTPLIFNIHVHDGAYCDEPTKGKFLAIDFWNQKRAFTDSTFNQLQEYKVALYDYSSGKISTQKSFERTDENRVLRIELLQTECDQDVEPELQAIIEEHFQPTNLLKPNEELTYKYTLLFFDKEGRLIVPEESH